MIKYAPRPEGIEEPLPYTGENALQWQPKWEDLAPENQSLIVSWVNTWRDLVGVPLKDIQLIASRAMSDCGPQSDYDIILVPEDDKEVENWKGVDRYTRFMAVQEHIAKVSDGNKIKLQVWMSWDARRLVCYSFFDNKWYGKKAGQVLNKKVKRNTRNGNHRELFDHDKAQSIFHRRNV